MTTTEQIIIISSLSLSVVNLATALWTMLRACQTYHLIKDRKKK